jgi:hypothetical protein
MLSIGPLIYLFTDTTSLLQITCTYKKTRKGHGRIVMCPQEPFAMSPRYDQSDMLFNSVCIGRSDIIILFLYRSSRAWLDTSWAWRLEQYTSYIHFLSIVRWQVLLTLQCTWCKLNAFIQPQIQFPALLYSFLMLTCTCAPGLMCSPECSRFWIFFA